MSDQTDRTDQGAVFEGLSMVRPLLLKDIVERAGAFFGDQEVVSWAGGVRRVRTVSETVERVRRLASSLSRLGVSVGDRVGTFAWNTQEHLELYLAVPAMGAVLHPVNIRLHGDDLSYIVGHAEDRVLFLDSSVADRMPRVESVAHEVLIGAGRREGALDYESLIADGDPDFAFPDIPETSASAMCYTSGTTGTPKAVVYSHRSTVLHTLVECLPDQYGFRESDVILPVVPMFHANAWGMPYAAFMVGARMVLPGEITAPEEIARLIATERVSFAAAITTIWHGVANLADPPDLSSLRQVVAGGAPLTEALLEQLDVRGIPVTQGFGMTEANPLVSVSRALARTPAEGPERTAALLSQGRVMPLVEARIDESVGGELLLRGNTIASGYYKAAPDPDRFTEDGWMRTGDIVDLDTDGVIHLVDRTKDLVKSGGEWISSVDLENAIMAHPAVAEASVVAAPHDRWGERPVAFVALRPGASLTDEDLRAHLGTRVARWWIPEVIEFVPEVAKTSIGKFDKKAMRRLAQHLAGAGRS